MKTSDMTAYEYDAKKFEKEHLNIDTISLTV